MKAFIDGVSFFPLSLSLSVLVTMGVMGKTGWADEKDAQPLRHGHARPMLVTWRPVTWMVLER